MAVMDSLLKCCHNCSIDDMNIKLEEGPPLLATDEVLSGHTLPTGPQDHAMRTYTLAEAVGLEGDPIHSGQLMYVRNGETTRVVTLSLYKNGFRLTPAKGDPELEEISSAWTPFSVLVKCHLRSVSAWSVFRVTNYTSAASVQSYHFATDGDAADSKREYWIQVMREVISGVTKSLFPLHSITVRPVPDVSATCERIMAGYLLLSDCSSGAALVYCELGAFKGGKATFAIYTDEFCVIEVSNVELQSTTRLTTYKGVHNTIFGIYDHLFCARTDEEKELWLRGVTNILTKLVCDAPDPTSAEIATFRAAVQDRIGGLQSEEKSSSDKEAILALKPRLPMPATPRGDDSTPEPGQSPLHTEGRDGGDLSANTTLELTTSSCGAKSVRVKGIIKV